MAEVEQDLLEVAKFIAKGIILEILKKQPRYPNTIRRLISDLIGEGRLKTLLGATEEPVPVLTTHWKEFVESIPYIRIQKGKCCYRNRPGVYRRNNYEYKTKLLSEMLKMLLDSDMKDVNVVGLNGNTVLHLLAALPMETSEAREVQIDLMKLLVERKPDCSAKNEQDMTPLHIIVGNYRLDPSNNFVVSDERGLHCAENTIGRREKLSCIERIIDKPVRFRGRNGNSILHEWVIGGCGAMSPSEVDNSIGEWIISIANVNPNVVNDYGCTPLYYAFTDNLLEFLRKNGASNGRSNDDGDTPLMYVIKHGVLPYFFCEIFPNGEDLEETFASKFNIQSSDLNLSNLSVSQPISYKVLKQQEFDFSKRDSSDRHCLDYLLLFVDLVLKEYEVTTSQDILTKIVEEWIMELAKNNEALKDGSAKEKAISLFIFAFFENKLDKKMLYDSVKELLDAGANPNHSCDNGTEFLHYSCEKASPDDPLHLDFLRMLCQNGAERSRKTQDGLTPIQILRNRQLVHHEICKVVMDTKPKQRVLVDIQSVQYKNQLDHLSRQTDPQRIEEFRYGCMIGKGSMGCVYLAIDENTRKEVALKRVVKTSFDKAIEAEIKALNKLEQTQNVVNLYSLKEDKICYYIALELMDGDLEFFVRTKANDLKDRDCKMAKDILRGLDFLHNLKPKNIIHRDLKPGNILYREKPEFCLKIADFGLAKHVNISSTCQTSIPGAGSTSLCGTRGWMAPELINRTQKTPTKESDMFAFGLVLHFLFSKGYHPFHSRSTSLLRDIETDNLKPHELEANITQHNLQIHTDLKPEQNDLVKQLLNMHPAERPPSNGLVKYHCFFWSKMKKVYFMWKVGDQPEVANPRSTPNSTFGSQLQISQFGCKNGIDWHKSFPLLYQEVSNQRRARSYDTSSVVDLIRFFRNCYAHFEERSPDRKNELLNDHFFVKFPDFFLTVFQEVYNQGWANPGSGKDWILRLIKEMD